MTTNLTPFAHPVEWILRPPAPTAPMGVVRRIDIDPHTAAYRLVTWAGRSEDRELVGYYRTLEDASAAAWNRWASTAPPAWIGRDGDAHDPLVPEPETMPGIVRAVRAADLSPGRSRTPAVQP